MIRPNAPAGRGEASRTTTLLKAFLRRDGITVSVSPTSACAWNAACVRTPCFRTAASMSGSAGK